MIFDWINNVSIATAFGVVALVFVAFCWLGIFVSRPLVRLLAQHQQGLNETVGDFLQYFGVIYGLLLGLLAVATYQNLSDVDKTVGNEAAALGALYRDAGAYPEPVRSEVQAKIRDYTRYVIDQAWPLQRQGIVPEGSVQKVAGIFQSLVNFEPQTKSQEALHQEALRQFNTFFQYRRERLQSVMDSIPAILWYTVIVGAFLNMMLMWLFDLRPGIHLLLGGVLSLFLATMITLILLLDQPFRGAVAISPDAFELVYDQLMKN